MRFGGKRRRSGIYEISIHNKFLGLFKPSSPLQIIHFHHNAVNFETQNEITEFELGIIG
jgi:hypothetical protein